MLFLDSTVKTTYIKYMYHIADMMVGTSYCGCFSFVVLLRIIL